MDTRHVVNVLRANPLITDEDRLTHSSATIISVIQTVASVAKDRIFPLEFSRARIKLTPTERTIVLRLKEHAGPALTDEYALLLERFATNHQERKLRDLQGIVDSLIHMHCNRMGLGPLEIRARALARVVLLNKTRFAITR